MQCSTALYTRYLGTYVGYARLINSARLSRDDVLNSNTTITSKVKLLELVSNSIVV